MVALIAGMLLYKKPKQSPQVATVAKEQPTATPTVNPNALPTGNSDTQLDQDSITLDQKISSMDADLETVDQGLNDKQTNLQ